MTFLCSYTISVHFYFIKIYLKLNSQQSKLLTNHLCGRIFSLVSLTLHTKSYFNETEKESDLIRKSYKFEQSYKHL